MSEETSEHTGKVSRRGFISASAGVATGVAVSVAPAAAVIGLDRSGGASAPIDPPLVVMQPSGPAPAEPITAYLRDAATGEVTVMAGTTETTYRDRALAKRLLDAAHSQAATRPSTSGKGESDVLAS